MSEIKIGIIGGSGVYKIEGIEVVKVHQVSTPFGSPSAGVIEAKLNGISFFFLPRHGTTHSLTPSEVNYRANISALHMQGVTEIAAIATVGGIHVDLAAGVIAMPHQIIDYTYGRKNTFYDGISLPVKHIDFTEPYCAKLRAKWQQAADDVGEPLIAHGIYASTQGPRLETAAEINRLERDGATMVGMTGMPEAALARELGISYATICPVANYAAGRGDSEHGIRYEEMVENLNQTMVRVRNIIAQLVKQHGVIKNGD